MSLINTSGVNFDSKMFLNQISNNTIPSTTSNSNEDDKVKIADLVIYCFDLKKSRIVKWT